MVALAISALVWLLDRGLLAAEGRGWIYYRHRKAASGTVSGAVFGPAFDLLQPSRQIVVEQQEHDRVAPTTDDEAQRRPPEQLGS
jgi:hypothetical protein